MAGHHTVALRVVEPGGTEAGSTTLAWDAANPAATDDAEAIPPPQLPIVVPLRGTLLNHPGMHKIELALDDELLSTLWLSVTKAEVPGVTTQLR